MNKFIAEQIEDAHRYATNAVNALETGRKHLAATLVEVELAADTDFYPYGGTFWFTVSNRKDVQTLMQLAPRWSKLAWEGGIDYTARVDDVEYRIRATDGALPPTCRLVEQEVEIPATPAKIVKRMVVECTT